MAWIDLLCMRPLHASMAHTIQKLIMVAANPTRIHVEGESLEEAWTGKTSDNKNDDTAQVDYVLRDS